MSTIKTGDFVEWINPLPDEIFAGESLKYKVIEVDGERALLEAVTPALHIRPTYRANVELLKNITDEVISSHVSNLEKDMSDNIRDTDPERN